MADDTQTQPAPEAEPAGPLSVSVEPRRNANRRTIATLDLQVSITIDENTAPLSLFTTEKIEKDLQAVKVQTRKNLEIEIKRINDLPIQEGEPPEKLMKCRVEASVWTDSIS